MRIWISLGLAGLSWSLIQWSIPRDINKGVWSLVFSIGLIAGLGAIVCGIIYLHGNWRRIVFRPPLLASLVKSAKRSTK